MIDRDYFEQSSIPIGAERVIETLNWLTVFTRLSAAPDWAPPPNERRIWDQIFFKERRPRMSAALNSVIIFHRQNGDI
jgi:hypothetical protein